VCIGQFLTDQKPMFKGCKLSFDYNSSSNELTLKIDETNGIELSLSIEAADEVAGKKN
jgi:hypothetical protein